MRTTSSHVRTAIWATETLAERVICVVYAPARAGAKKCSLETEMGTREEAKRRKGRVPQLSPVQDLLCCWLAAAKGVAHSVLGEVSTFLLRVSCSPPKGPLCQALEPPPFLSSIHY